MSAGHVKTKLLFMMKKVGGWELYHDEEGWRLGVIS